MTQSSNILGSVSLQSEPHHIHEHADSHFRITFTKASISLTQSFGYGVIVVVVFFLGFVELFTLVLSLHVGVKPVFGCECFWTLQARQLFSGRFGEIRFLAF